MVSDLRKLVIAILLLWCAAMVVPSAQAGGIYVLGDQDFSDGDTPVGVAGFEGPSAGEPAPFDQFYGSNYDENFDETWTFNFPTPTSVISATLEFGIFDHDSAASGDQVAIFTIDGVDRTADANSAFESHGGSQNEVNVYSFSVNPTLLADGVLVVRLQLQGPGLQGSQGEVPPVAQPTEYNGAGLDFSRLTIVQEGVPELELSLTTVISLAAAALLIAKKRWVKTL